MSLINVTISCPINFAANVKGMMEKTRTIVSNGNRVSKHFLDHAQFFNLTSVNNFNSIFHMNIYPLFSP
jgi:hypothetical protein